MAKRLLADVVPNFANLLCAVYDEKHHREQEAKERQQGSRVRDQPLHRLCPADLDTDQFDIGC